jgi:hypothetical protein
MINDYVFVGIVIVAYGLMYALLYHLLNRRKKDGGHTTNNIY